MAADATAPAALGSAPSEQLPPDRSRPELVRVDVDVVVAGPAPDRARQRGAHRLAAAGGAGIAVGGLLQRDDDRAVLAAAGLVDVRPDGTAQVRDGDAPAELPPVEGHGRGSLAVPVATRRLVG